MANSLDYKAASPCLILQAVHSGPYSADTNSKMHSWIHEHMNVPTFNETKTLGFHRKSGRGVTTDSFFERLQ